jgi:hypothetical protein
MTGLPSAVVFTSETLITEDQMNQNFQQTENFMGIGKYPEYFLWSCNCASGYSSCLRSVLFSVRRTLAEIDLMEVTFA